MKHIAEKFFHKNKTLEPFRSVQWEIVVPRVIYKYVLKSLLCRGFWTTAHSSDTLSEELILMSSWFMKTKFNPLLQKLNFIINFVLEALRFPFNIII